MTEKTTHTTDETYMLRCLQLAAQGRQESRPNPMVGAVIVARGRIIGEGYHVRCGEGHAEVNAFGSVRKADEALLRESTVYVSLEPCAHYGRTPPCADLIASRGVRRVVVGCVDPFARVQGRGIERIRQAGISVTVGVLREECEWLNRRFFTFHRLGRPHIILKWAQSRNLMIDNQGRAARLSTPLTQALVHKLRSEEDAILVGRVTDEREHPQLNVRLWDGRQPVRFVLSRHTPLEEVLRQCREQQLQSLIVEGGAQTLQSFLDKGLWDEIRMETAPVLLPAGGTRAPQLPDGLLPLSHERVDGNEIMRYVSPGAAVLPPPARG